MITHKDILAFWFRGEDSYQKFWWVKDPAFDKEIQEKFEKLLIEIKKGEHDDWKKSPEGRLALVIVLDQFSRNMYRDTPKSFEADEKALQLVMEGIDEGDDLKLSSIERSVFYMSLMHAEDVAVQKISLKKFTELDRITKNGTAYAQEHKRLIDLYGRFPHRNKILGRESTKQEKEYLAKPGSGF